MNLVTPLQVRWLLSIFTLVSNSVLYQQVLGTHWQAFQC